jgi:hypothetical protein
MTGQKVSSGKLEGSTDAAEEGAQVGYPKWAVRHELIDDSKVPTIVDDDPDDPSGDDQFTLDYMAMGILNEAGEVDDEGELESPARRRSGRRPSPQRRADEQAPQGALGGVVARAMHPFSCAADIAFDLLLVLDRHDGRWMGSRSTLAAEIIAVNGGIRPAWMLDDPPTTYLHRGVPHARRLLYPDVKMRVFRPLGSRHQVVSMREVLPRK